jgi:hypothetical protein
MTGREGPEAEREFVRNEPQLSYTNLDRVVSGPTAMVSTF